MSAGDWCLLESDPGLFSALIREFGFSGAHAGQQNVGSFQEGRHGRRQEGIRESD